MLPRLAHDIKNFLPLVCEFQEQLLQKYDCLTILFSIYWMPSISVYLINLLKQLEKKSFCFSYLCHCFQLRTETSLISLNIVFSVSWGSQIPVLLIPCPLPLSLFPLSVEEEWSLQTWAYSLSSLLKIFQWLQLQVKGNSRVLHRAS